MNPVPEKPDEGEEIAHYDDAIIGKAFRWSAVVLLLPVVAGAGLFFFLKKKPAPPPPKVTQIEAPVVQSFAGVEVPQVRFSDVTVAAGISFVHNNGAVGDKLLPETMGGGVGFFDFDN